MCRSRALGNPEPELVIRRYRRRVSETEESSRKGYAGCLPFVAVGFGAGTGGWIASLVGLPQWTLAIPGMIAGYFVSRTILRRIYSLDD